MKQLMMFLAFMFSIITHSQTNNKTDKERADRTEKSKTQGRENRFLEDFKELNLSEIQQTRLKTLFENERSNMQQTRQRFRGEDEERPSASEIKEMREKMKERAGILDGKVKEILSEEQYTKWKEKREQRMKEFSGR